ncbi:sigma-70 family RNA polymerase sigma factor [Streptomyces sp. NPDC048290]|uniref:sigma-70 family RNA polymerase sigma factor n=1 Tax=Streptomyces sp. NPDC048290 TaxID=3155811 RepID=UPI00343BBCE3
MSGSTTERITPDRAATLDEETLAELIRLHGGYLRRALSKYTNGDLQRAEDLLQETMLRAWQNPEALSRGPEEARPWLFTVARRIAIDHFRMRAARPQESTDEMPERQRNAHDPFEEVLLARDMRVALAELAPLHREVLVELHMKGRSLAQVAERLKVPVGTVKSRHFYAIRACREIFQKHGLGPIPVG